MIRRSFIAAVLFWTSNAVAYETVGMRSLQKGPVGSGSAFIDFGRTGYEAVGAMVRQNGRASTPTARVSGSIAHDALLLAHGMPVNETLYFSLFFNYRAEHADFASPGNTFTYRREASGQELGAGPTLRVGEIIFGGLATAHVLGSETTTIVASGAESIYELPHAVVPALRLFAALDMPRSRFAVGVKLPGAKTVDRQTTALGLLRHDESKRSVARELWLDGRLQVGEVVELGFDFTYSTPPDAGVNIGENSPLGDRGDNPNASHMTVGFGGIYQATPGTSFHSALRYIEPAYAKPDYASPFFDNLGGAEIRVGSAMTGGSYRFYYEVGYFIPRNLSTAAGARTPHAWATAGETVTMEEEKWLFAFGATMKTL